VLILTTGVRPTVSRMLPNLVMLVYSDDCWSVVAGRARMVDVFNVMRSAVRSIEGLAPHTVASSP
jgi:hypothetical protein